MQKVTLKLTVNEVRVLYKAMIRLKSDDEQAISSSERFKESSILREGAKEAMGRAAITDGLIRSLLSNLTTEQWRDIVIGGL